MFTGLFFCASIVHVLSMFFKKKKMYGIWLLPTVFVCTHIIMTFNVDYLQKNFLGEFCDRVLGIFSFNLLSFV